MESSWPVLVVVAGVASLAGGVLVYLVVGAGSRRAGAERLARLAEATDQIKAQQSELGGRLQQTQSNVNERLEALMRLLGEGLSRQTERTGETLKTLHERLAVIDAAQKNITDLSQQMVGLQEILGNKQARGAFGEIQLRDLVTTILPPSVYEFQATLSNRTRVDCLLRLPNPPGAIGIDAKFPLESYVALREAKDETARTRAARAFAADVLSHIRGIAEKYILAGETAESAILFMPSEAVYAELHANFRSVIEESFRRRVWIVSPTTLMATLNTVRAILKDAQMKEQAGVIQAEVVKLLEDVVRLDTRVESLERHFDQAGRDIEQIRTSARKIASRGERIDELQLGPETGADELTPPEPRIREA